MIFYGDVIYFRFNYNVDNTAEVRSICVLLHYARGKCVATFSEDCEIRKGSMYFCQMVYRLDCFVILRIPEFKFIPEGHSG
jgi:hypothetical protein